MISKSILLASLLLYLNLEAENQNINPEKILICGICKNIEPAAEYTIKNIENLGNRFTDYRAIIYENNSKDNTASLLSAWAEKNDRITFITENLSNEELPVSRTEKIARARNIVLSLAKEGAYSDYDYLVMVDLDFKIDWPIDELINTLHSNVEWDSVSANGWTGEGTYGDRYAFRDKNFPLGPELLGVYWTTDLYNTWFSIDQEEWLPVYSAFGGLAIYKMRSILPFIYSGIVTEDLKAYYKEIIRLTPKDHRHIRKYLKMIGKAKTKRTSDISIIFVQNTPEHQPTDYPFITCCEHVPLHASMALNGFGKFFINPKLKFERTEINNHIKRWDE